MRYRLILDRCDATDKRWWDKSICAANSLIELHQQQPGLSYDQRWHVEDTLRGKSLSRDEFLGIVMRLFREKYERAS